MTTLIKNGLVYDGVAREPTRADVLFRNGKIQRVQPSLPFSADKVVDASGCVVIPGLFDTGSDIDRYGGFFSNDVQKEFLRQGITTVIGGGSGVSLAPFRKDLFQTFFYSPDSFAGNADWDSFARFLDVLRGQRTRLHVGSMAGFRNLYSPSLPSTEIRRRVKETLREGALGISFHLDDPVSHPISLRALQAAAETLSSSGKVCSLRLDPSRVSSGALHMFSRIFSRLRGKFHISRFRPHASLEPFFGGYADLSPSKYLPYPLYGFLPPSFRCLEFSEMTRRVLDPVYEEEILSRLRALPIADVLLGHVPHHLAHFRGKRLRDLVFHFQLTLPRAVLHLMRLSGLRATLLLKNAGFSHILPFLRHPSSLLSSGGTLPLASSLPPSCVFHASLLHSFAESSGLLFGEVLSKMTSLPAALYGVSRRGRIAEGSYADVVLLKDWNVLKVFVDGELVFDHGAFYDAFPGKVIT